MKKMYVVLCLILSSLFFINPAYAERFYINNYYTEYTVHEDATIDTLEGISAFFHTKAHGIVKDINRNNDIITHIHATENKETHSTPSVISVKMGDSGKYILGDKLYTVKYKIHMRDLNISQLRLDIVSPAWNTEIKSVNFKVTMPKNISPEDVKIYKISNKKIFEDKNIPYTVRNNVIAGYTGNTLQPYEGYVVAVNLPYGYFVRKQDYTPFFTLAAILILTMGVISIWAIYGKDKHVTPIVTFKAPNEINPMDAGIILKGSASSDEFTAYIVSLMGKNYIEMEENGEFFKLKKGQDFGNAKEKDSEILKILFHEKEEVTKTDLESSKYIEENVRNFVIDANQRKELFFETISKNASVFTVMFIFTLLVIFTSNFVCTLYDFGGTMIQTFFFFMVFMGLGLLCAAVASCSDFESKAVSSVLCASTFIFLFVLVYVFGGQTFPLNNLIFKIGIFCSFICVICTINLPKRNDLGTRLMGELLGLKHFIKVAEKNRLEALINENPLYFYNILPYAYILGVSNVWIKKFQGIGNIIYKGSNITTHSFNHMSSSLSSSCRSYSSGSSGSSGSHGGGGGRAW